MLTRRTLGVIFDMDGVLVDSADAHYEAWCILGKELGKVHTREFFERTFGMHNREIIPLWLGDVLPREEVDRLSDHKEAVYRQVAATKLRPLDGAMDLLESLAQDGFLLAIGSSGPRPNVELMLDVLGVRRFFSAFSTGDEVREGKPHPEVFLAAARKLGLPPRECAVVEDAPQGIQAGLAAGARVIAVTSTRAPAELGAAHLVVDSLKELDPRRIRALLGGGDS